MAEADPFHPGDLRRADEIELSPETSLAAQLRDTQEPVVVRGLVSNWPLVVAGLQSPRSAREHLLAKSHAVPFSVSIGNAGDAGRMFYDEDMRLNFRNTKGKLSDIFAQMEDVEGKPDAPLVYLGSVDMRVYFDGLADANPSPVSELNPMESIWIGGRTQVPAHNDFPNNLACCAVGKRRFTIFPPDQFENLYLGPFDNTPAGRPVAMVDLRDPDFEKFPRLREALAHALVADLDPGDAVYVPSNWWHQVEGLSDFNVLVNYWWRETPAWLGQPQDALHHAMLSVRDLPPHEKAYWHALFERYVFSDGTEAAAHLPDDARGILAPLTRETAAALRTQLLRNLNR